MRPCPWEHLTTLCPLYEIFLFLPSSYPEVCTQSRNWNITFPEEPLLMPQRCPALGCYSTLCSFTISHSLCNVILVYMIIWIMSFSPAKAVSLYKGNTFWHFVHNYIFISSHSGFIFSYTHILKWWKTENY